MSGLGALIMYGTGSHVSHSTMALRMEDDELYIVESREDGIVRTKWAEWISGEESRGTYVNWHRLREEVRADFDT